MLPVFRLFRALPPSFTLTFSIDFFFPNMFIVNDVKTSVALVGPRAHVDSRYL